MTAKIFSWLRFPSQHLTKSRTISRRSTIKAQLHEMEMEKTECLQQGENLKTKERIGFIFVTWKQSLCFILTVRKKQVKVMITFNAAHFMPVYFYSNNSQQQLLQGALKGGPHTPQC